jgi:hypothetical protein
MTELEIAGVGIWSPFFSDWPVFVRGVSDKTWQEDAKLQPDLIPVRERRRAPLSVKLAVESMSQACTMAQIDPGTAAVVFSSAMGDIQITDYMCKVLAAPPRMVSPIKFHNSVHNATTGYWSMVSKTHAATNAVSAYQYTASVALLEAAIQAYEEPAPVLLVAQEMATVGPLKASCPSRHPFSMTLLLTQKGQSANPLATLGFEVRQQAVDWPDLPAELDDELSSNFGAKLMPLIVALARGSNDQHATPVNLSFPMNQSTSLAISMSHMRNTI